MKTSNPKHAMGDYCTPLGGIIEITPTEGQIMCPEGCIMPQRDAVDRDRDRDQRDAVDRGRRPEVEASRGGIMQPEGYIICPEGGVSSISLRRGVQ